MALSNLVLTNIYCVMYETNIYYLQLIITLKMLTISGYKKMIYN